MRLAVALAVLSAVGGCHESTNRAIGPSLPASPVQITAVDVSVTATDSQAGATVTVDIPTGTLAGSGSTPVTASATNVSIPGTAPTSVAIESRDDTSGPNRRTGTIQVR